MESHGDLNSNYTYFLERATQLRIHIFFNEMNTLVYTHKIDIRDVVITSVLDDDPPCVGEGGLCKMPPVW